MRYIKVMVLLVIILPAMNFAEDIAKNEGRAQESEVEKLSPNLRTLLSKEMLALQAGMMSIIPAYNSGNWGEVEITAKKMKDSYILKQSLSKKQVKELHSILSDEFIKQDQRFHYLAGMLEHAAKNRKPELVNFYFSEMNESCGSCHSDFARHKFPALAPKKISAHSH